MSEPSAKENEKSETPPEERVSEEDCTDSEDVSGNSANDCDDHYYDSFDDLSGDVEEKEETEAPASEVNPLLLEFQRNVFKLDTSSSNKKSVQEDEIKEDLVNLNNLELPKLEGSTTIDFDELQHGTESLTIKEEGEEKPKEKMPLSGPNNFSSAPSQPSQEQPASEVPQCSKTPDDVEDSTDMVEEALSACRAAADLCDSSMEGGNYMGDLETSMMIEKSLCIQLSCSKYVRAMMKWGDLMQGKKAKTLKLKNTEEFIRKKEKDINDLRENFERCIEEHENNFNHFEEAFNEMDPSSRDVFLTTHFQNAKLIRVTAEASEKIHEVFKKCFPEEHPTTVADDDSP